MATRLIMDSILHDGVLVTRTKNHPKYRSIVQMKLYSYRSSTQKKGQGRQIMTLIGRFAIAKQKEI
jgi:hypothetical protein